MPGSLGRTVQEAEGPACCDPTTRSHTMVEKHHQPPFAGETWHQTSALSVLRTLTIKTYSKDLNGPATLRYNLRKQYINFLILLQSPLTSLEYKPQESQPHYRTDIFLISCLQMVLSKPALCSLATLV